MNKPTSENLPDKNFNDYATRLKNTIYGSLKGKIRLKILLNDLDQFLKDNTPPLQILDAGCGLAQCALALAQKGHRLTLCDISSAMIKESSQEFARQGIRHARFLNESVQTHALNHQAYYDVILCHAVIEWTENPQELLAGFKRMLKPGGYLSLMFFNRTGTIFKSVLRGNFFEKDAGFKFGRTSTLTPTNPLDSAAVLGWLHDLDLTVVKKSGVRIFYDYCESSIRDQLDEKQVLNCELSFSQSEPYMSLARYIHVLCKARL